MYATVFILGFLLALLAHVKIMMLQSSLASVMSVIGDRFKVVDAKVARMEAYQVRPDAPSIGQRPIEAEKQAGPADIKADIKQDHAKLADIAVVLQTFYGLNETGRHQVFDAVHAEVHGHAFEVLYKACKDSARPAQRASDLQSVLTMLDAKEFGAVKQAILNASVDHHAKPKLNTVADLPGPKSVVPEVVTAEQPVAPIVETVVQTEAPEVHVSGPATPVGRKRKPRASKVPVVDTNVLVQAA